MLDAIQDWLSLLFRWAHVVAAISWIGSSFYFMWLDVTLKRRARMSTDIMGENWTVHGGGFYHTQKYMVAPESMPEDLHWFRFEAYFTWLTGFSLLVVTYYWGASSFLLNPARADLAPWEGIALSAGGLLAGWLLYDLLCRSPLRNHPTALFGILFLVIVSFAWAYTLVFSDRAAYLQAGAMIATIMSANVLFVIIPNQRIVVRSLKAGENPDPNLGAIAKLRSTHNNYLTLPVIFLMISNHYPMTYGHDLNWLIVAMVLVIGAIIRNWFNRYEAGVKGPLVYWQWPVAAALVMVLMGMTLPRADFSDEGDVAASEALAIVQLRCASCHAARPTEEGYDEPPGGIAFDTLEEIRRHASLILAQSVLTEVMPLANVTEMTEEERRRLGAWIRAGTPEE